MALSTNDVVARMRQALALTEPELDTTVGSTLRKVLDAVGEVVAEASADTTLTTYAYDVDSKLGTALDDFVRVFGMTRREATRATGLVTFERPDVDFSVFIASGTQLATLDSPPLLFATEVPGVMDAHQTTIDIPARCLMPGVGGNVLSGAVRQFVTPIVGISSISNPTAFSGGSAAETDQQLQERFKKTVFRSLAGTEQQFLGTALEDADVTQANVVGTSKVHREQIELVGGLGTSTVQDAAYIYPESSVFGTDLITGTIYKEGVHYSFDPVTGTVTTLDGTLVPDGVYELEFRYVSTASRNEPAIGKTNRIDVYVNGERATDAVEDSLWTNSRVFNEVFGDTYNRTSWERDDGQTQPVAGNFFLPLTFGPLIELPGTLDIGADTYTLNEDYFLVSQTTPNGFAADSLFGLEWRSVANGGTEPTPDTAFNIEYSYNAVPADVRVALDRWRLVTTDLKVHAARKLLVNLNLAIIYLPGASHASVNDRVNAALQALFTSIPFDGVVQVSDVLSEVHSVSGVDAARFVNSSEDSEHYAMQRVDPTDGVTIQHTYDNGGSPARAIDILVGDDELPVLNSVRIIARAQNTINE